MRYTPSLWNQDRDIEEIWFLMLTYLDYLYSLFLIHMTVAQHTATKSAALYSTARELLQRNRVSGVKSDLTWVVWSSHFLFFFSYSFFSSLTNHLPSFSSTDYQVQSFPPTSFCCNHNHNILLHQKRSIFLAQNSSRTLASSYLTSTGWPCPGTATTTSVRKG